MTRELKGLKDQLVALADFKKSFEDERIKQQRESELADTITSVLVARGLVEAKN